MLKNRSKAWTKQRNHLEVKEGKIKEELENVSEDFEGQVKRVATISLITGVAVLGAYGLYRLFRKEELQEKSEPVPSRATVSRAPVQEVPVTKPSFSFKKLVAERLAVIALKFIGAQLTVFLANKFGLEDSEETLDD